MFAACCGMRDTFLGSEKMCLEMDLRYLQIYFIVCDSECIISVATVKHGGSYIFFLFYKSYLQSPIIDFICYMYLSFNVARLLKTKTGSKLSNIYLHKSS